jgi:hypothetical protein
LALAFDLPVIIKSEGNVVDFESHEIGIFMRHAEETESAMRQMLQMPLDQRTRLRAKAREASRLHSWSHLSALYRAAFDAFESVSGSPEDHRADPHTPHRPSP